MFVVLAVISFYCSFGLLVGGILAIHRQTAVAHGFIGMAIVAVYCMGLWPKVLRDYSIRLYYYRKTNSALMHLKDCLKDCEDIKEQAELSRQILAFQALHNECKMMLEDFWR